jgi:hypothetical protein
LDLTEEGGKVGKCDRGAVVVTAIRRVNAAA